MPLSLQKCCRTVFVAASALTMACSLLAAAAPQPAETFSSGNLPPLASDSVLSGTDSEPPPQPPPPAWYVLNQAGPGITIGGSAVLFAIQGGVINSSDPEALCSFGNPTIKVPWIKSVGGNAARYPQSADQQFIPIPTPLPDPLQYTPEVDVEMLKTQGLVPEAVPADGFVPVSQRQLGSYHYFTAGTLTGTVRLTPGIYIIEGDLSADLIGQGVMLFIRDGNINIGKNCAIRLTAPMWGDFPAASTYAGISIWQARGNASAATLQGNATVVTQGIVYMPAATLCLRSGAEVYSNVLIVGAIDLNGNAALTLSSSIR